MHDYRSLEVWKYAFSLCVKIHKFCNELPHREQFSLGEQMRRSSLSIPSNIAEGKGRSGDKEMRRYCLIAYGSAMELQTQLMICDELELGQESNRKELVHLNQSVLKLLNAYLRFLDRQITP